MALERDRSEEICWHVGLFFMGLAEIAVFILIIIDTMHNPEFNSTTFTLDKSIFTSNNNTFKETVLF
jgi:hypothetical protein